MNHRDSRQDPSLAINSLAFVDTSYGHVLSSLNGTEITTSAPQQSGVQVYRRWR